MQLKSLLRLRLRRSDTPKRPAFAIGFANLSQTPPASVCRLAGCYVSRVVPLSLLSLLSVSSFACSCRFAPHDVYGYHRADGVYIVEITETWVDRNEKGKKIGRAEFDVVGTFKKGKNPELLEFDSGNCSIPLISGEKYWVFSDGSPIFRMDMCSMSREFNDVLDRDVIELYKKIAT